MITSEGRELRRRIEGAYLEHIRGRTSATQYLGALGDLLDEEADRRAVREGDPDSRHLEHILSELRYEVAIHEMVEDFKRIQGERRLRAGLVETVARRLEYMARCASDDEWMPVAGMDLRLMAADLREALGTADDG